MDKTIRVLFVGPDTGLEDEINDALQHLGSWRVYPYLANSYAKALEVARDRQPGLVCFYSNGLDDDWRLFAKDLHVILPEVALVVMYDPGLFRQQSTEHELIIQMLRENVKDFLRRPLASTEIRQLLDRLLVSPQRRLSPHGLVLTVMSNKGGVGKSTLSVNLATELATRHPGRVLLIDASLQLGICAMMLDLPTTPTMLDAVRARERLDEGLLRQLTLAHSSGLHLLAAPIDASQAAEIDDSAFARILNLARREFDYVVVDTFPLVDPLVLSTLDVSDMLFLLLQGTVPNVVGVARFLPIIDGIGVAREKQRIVLNLNHAKVASALTVADIESRLQRSIDHILPYTPGILRALNNGKPYVLQSIRLWGFTKRIVVIANEVEALRQEILRQWTDEGATRGAR